MRLISSDERLNPAEGPRVDNGALRLAPENAAGDWAVAEPRPGLAGHWGGAQLAASNSSITTAASNSPAPPSAAATRDALARWISSARA
jgi:hypothetical protein